MEKTKYANSHGLSNSDNKSCPFDLALLCEYAMNNKRFRDIVSCRVYETLITVEGEGTHSLPLPDDSPLGDSESCDSMMESQ